jgi:hypothetical protein
VTTDVAISPRPLRLGRLLSACTAEEAYLFFRRFIALKIGAPLLFDNVLQLPFPPFVVIPIVAAAVVVSGLRRHFQWGLLVILAISLGEIWLSWPFTLNHVVLEALIVGMMILDPGETIKGPSTARLIQFLMLSVWFYSGIQKLFHGYYMSGEYMALEAFSGESRLGVSLAWLLHSLERATGAPPFPPLHCCVTAPLSLQWWEVAILRSLGILTVAAEIGFPLLLLFRRTRAAGVFLLFCLQLAIGIFSREIDFAFTSTAILLLFTPKIARVGYAALAIAFLVVAPWR